LQKENVPPRNVNPTLKNSKNNNPLPTKKVGPRPSMDANYMNQFQMMFKSLQEKIDVLEDVIGVKENIEVVKELKDLIFSPETKKKKARIMITKAKHAREIDIKKCLHYYEQALYLYPHNNTLKKK